MVVACIEYGSRREKLSAKFLEANSAGVRESTWIVADSTVSELCCWSQDSVRSIVNLSVMFVSQRG
jgi:hypothetical protein